MTNAPDLFDMFGWYDTGSKYGLLLPDGTRLGSEVSWPYYEHKYNRKWVPELSGVWYEVHGRKIWFTVEEHERYNPLRWILETNSKVAKEASDFLRRKIEAVLFTIDDPHSWKRIQEKLHKLPPEHNALWWEFDMVKVDETRLEAFEKKLNALL